MGGRGSGGRNRLSPETHLKRGTFRSDRHAVARATPAPDNEAYSLWLTGLTPAAQAWGRWFFEKGQVPTDRAALREYLETFAIYAALPRTRETSIDLLAAMHDKVVELNEACRWTWR
jgi:hypothetical protein